MRFILSLILVAFCVPQSASTQCPNEGPEYVGCSNCQNFWTAGCSGSGLVTVNAGQTDTMQTSCERQPISCGGGVYPCRLTTIIVAYKCIGDDDWQFIRKDTCCTLDY